MLNDQQRDYLLPKAFNAALRAGAAILEVYSRDTTGVAVDLKSDMTPITIADRNSHELIKDYLCTTRIPVLSEEGREMLYAERQGWDLFWLVDPLDGTKEFIRHNGEFTVNIALVSDNKPVLGVVYVPCLDRVYFCDKELGAFRKTNVKADSRADFSIEELMSNAVGLPLNSSGNTPVRIAISRSHNTPETFVHVDRIREEHPCAEVMEQGSSYKFCLLAEGEIDYYVRTTDTYEWDTAAGEILLEISGGSTQALPGGGKLSYNKESLVNPHFICRSRAMEDPVHGCKTEGR